MQDLISIIIPVYNAENYIKKCVESILSQTYSNFELILVNDGSIDKSLEILHKLEKEDNRIVVLERENGGASAARNSGLDIAKGNYIVFADSDDFVSPDYLKNLYFASKEKGYDIVQCNLEKTAEIDCSPKSVVFSSFDLLDITKEEALNDRNYKVTIWGKIYNSALFDHFRFKENIIYEDDDSYYQLAYYAKKIGLLNETLYFYFMSPNSVMRNDKKNKSLAFIDIYERRKQFFKKKGEAVLYEGSVKRYCLVLCLSYCSFKKNETNKNDLKRLYELFKDNYSMIRKSSVISSKENLLFKAFNACPNLTSLVVGIVRK